MVKDAMDKIYNNGDLVKYVDFNYKIPEVFCGTENIELIILGQDPTVKSKASRSNITTVLQLNENYQLKKYLSKICTKLNIDLNKNVYATNLYKNFFIEPPTQINDVDIFEAFLPIWLPILLEELKVYEDVPVLVLGEPLLKAVTNSNCPKEVKYYWGYSKKWANGKLNQFFYIERNYNKLNRAIFPFPHQPSINRIKFYKTQFDSYCNFIASNL